MNLRSLVTVAALACVSILFGRNARADEPSAPSPPKDPSAPSPPKDPSAPNPQSESSAPTASTWYGWQTLIVDGASALTFGVGAGAGSGAVALLGLGGFVAGAPIVHGVNGQGWRAAASLGVRVLTPVLAGAFAAAVARPAPCHPDAYGPCLNWLDAPFTGALVGLLVASAFDAAVIAYAPAEPAKPAIGLSLAPQIDPARGAYGLSVVGTSL